MSAPAILVEDLWKEYVLGGAAEHGQSIADGLRRAVLAPWRRLRELRGGGRLVRFQALQGVDLAVDEGEVVGLIGANGAGKSTLLKILSRITDPSRGRAVVRGRLSSLLEVGTGFHSELTGRENIFLNGAILGMPRREVRAKFDAIVAFAGVEAFLDTPVKRYSSGMYLRLAFAVAAHLDPDVLVVDEVLAVGDAEFQRRCLGRMREAGREGRTVLFVSHDLGTVTQLCARAYWLDRGRIRMSGPSRDVVRAYLEAGTGEEHEWVGAPSEEPFALERVRVLTSDGGPVRGEVLAADGFQVLLAYVVRGDLRNQRLTVRLVDESGQVVFVSASTDGTSAVDRSWTRGRFAEACHVPGHLLRPGRYHLSVSHPDARGRDHVHDGLLSVTVDAHTSLVRRDRRGGAGAPPLRWEGVEAEDPRRRAPGPDDAGE